ncbi:MAG: hypothetical protein IPP66_06375 [Anaerolineales bacterium]|nr:hypothetical protein [Anaerolineales bacterium]
MNVIYALSDFFLSSSLILFGASVLVLLLPYLLYYTSAKRYEIGELQTHFPELSIVGGYPFFIFLLLPILFLGFICASETLPDLAFNFITVGVACVALFHGIFALKFAVYPLFVRTSLLSSKMFYFHDQGRGIKILGLIQITVSMFVILATILVVLVNLSI